MKNSAILLAALALVLAACGSAAESETVATTITTLVPVTTLPQTSTATIPTTTTTAAPQTPTIDTTPMAGDVVDRYLQVLEGTTDPDATVIVNGEPVAVASDGSFTAEWLNSIGSNSAVVAATGTNGTSSTLRITYTFEPRDGWVEAIGDSVMLGSAKEIEKRLGDRTVDATVSRQFLGAPALVRSFVARQDPPELIVIGLGTNGPVQARHFDEVMELAADVPLVAFVNVRVPRSWEGTSNREIAEGVERYDNAILVDWYEVTWNRNNLFAKDGVHPKQAGRVIMAELIADAVFPNWVPLEDS